MQVRGAVRLHVALLGKAALHAGLHLVEVQIPVRLVEM